MNLDNSYLVIGIVNNLILSPNSIHFFDDFIISNNYSVLDDALLNNPLIKSYLGDVYFAMLKNGATFVFASFHEGYSDTIQAISHTTTGRISAYLDNLFFIKDNSIFTNYFYSIPYDKRNNAGIIQNNSIVYNAEGYMRNTELSEMELSEFEQLNLQLFPIMSVPTDTSFYHNDGTQSKNVGIISTSEYESFTKIQRGIIFLKAARATSYLPLKITNYIAFLDCLFCTTESGIAQQVAQRVSSYLHYFDNAVDKTSILIELKKFYDIRSKYIHGDSKIKKFNNNEDLRAASVKIDGYCRTIVKLILDNSQDTFKDNRSINDFFNNNV